MTQCNTLNIKVSNSQLNKFKSEIKNNTEVTFIKTLSNTVGDCNDENNFPHKFFLTKLLEIIPQLIQNHQKLSYIKWNNQEHFCVEF